MMTVYLSGPMEGIDGHNYSLFNITATKLRLRGYPVLNPAEVAPHALDRPRSYFMRQDLKLLLNRAEALAVLEGWERSRGSVLEVAAAIELDLPIFTAASLIIRKPMQIKPAICMEVAA